MAPDAAGTLGRLLEEADTLHPDDLASFVRRHAEGLGLGDVCIFVVDRDQRQLTPLSRGEVAQAVDGSLAGRCYQRSEVVAADPASGSGLTWFPVLDGTNRLGVLCARIDSAAGGSVDLGRQLATLVAYLIVAKRAYGDNLVRAAEVERLTLAAEIRWAVLPPLAFEGPMVAVGAMLQPAYEIAGDTFDYAVDDATLHLAVFDAMGHGLRASQLANLALFAYRNARRGGAPLESVYGLIDAAVNRQYGDECFVTAQITTLDLETGILRTVTAGHPPPLLLRDRTTVSELAARTNVPLGVGERDPVVSESQLQPGDTLLYYSDGVVEARSTTREQFGVDRLVDLVVRSAASELTPAETVRRAAHAVFEHHGGDLEDDATLVLVCWKGSRDVE